MTSYIYKEIHEGKSTWLCCVTLRQMFVSLPWAAYEDLGAEDRIWQARGGAEFVTKWKICRNALCLRSHTQIAIFVQPYHVFLLFT